MSILILPLIFLTYVFRKQLSRLTARLPLSLSFPLFTIVFGLCIETFAILENLHRPLAERILLSPYPLTDLFFGIFYYGLVGITWYLLLKRISFNKKDIFLLMGLVGIGTEQVGAIFLGAISSLGGFFLALIIASIYGTFPTLAYFLTEDRFNSLPRKKKTLLSYLIAACFLFIQWALFGLFVLPSLRALF